jgi:hypothetical protein
MNTLPIHFRPVVSYSVDRLVLIWRELRGLPIVVSRVVTASDNEDKKWLSGSTIILKVGDRVRI